MADFSARQARTDLFDLTSSDPDRARRVLPGDLRLGGRTAAREFGGFATSQERRRVARLGPYMPGPADRPTCGGVPAPPMTPRPPARRCRPPAVPSWYRRCRWAARADARRGRQRGRGDRLLATRRASGFVSAVNTARHTGSSPHSTDYASRSTSTCPGARCPHRGRHRGRSGCRRPRRLRAVFTGDLATWASWTPKDPAGPAPDRSGRSYVCVDDVADTKSPGRVPRRVGADGPRGDAVRHAGHSDRSAGAAFSLRHPASRACERFRLTS